MGVALSLAERDDADYSQLSSDEFHKILEEIVDGMTASEILSIQDCATILAEELNNEVLSRWQTDNPEKAFPQDYENGEDDDD